MAVEEVSVVVAEVDATLADKFLAAGWDLWYNIYAYATGTPVDWSGLKIFYDEVFYPYMIGGIIPGLIVATVGYMLSVPLIRTYQQRRRRKIKAKFEAIKKRAELEPVNSPHAPSGTTPPSRSPKIGRTD